jgi:uncharacterized protein (DUF1800 family)
VSATAKKKPKKKKRRCRTVVDRKTRRRKKVCTPATKKKRAPAAKKKAPVKVPPAPKALPGQPVPSAAAPPATAGLPAPAGGPGPGPTPTPPPPPPPPPDPDPEDPPAGIPRQGTFGPKEAERLLWRAGFGPRPGEVATFATYTVEQAVHALTRPQSPEQLLGAAPVDSQGAPYNEQRAHGEYGANVIWWFDRMLRTSWPLAERMALVWHDWFATADRQIIGRARMIKQYKLLKQHWAGNFRRLALEVTVDEAMLKWLNGVDNAKGAPNENYARELMELFTLGADRGAYTETDVRELARVLTGYSCRWLVEIQDDGDFRLYPERHDTGTKTLWAGTPHERRGTFGWAQRNGIWESDAVDLCLQNPFHPSFFVRKLWSYFIPSDPPPATQAGLEELYVAGGYEVRPVLEAILMHPDLYADRRMVKPPAVYIAGLMRARGATIRTYGFDGVLEVAGQRLFDPPDVAGWRDSAWLDTSTLLGRAEAVTATLDGHDVPVDGTYPRTETGPEAVAKALQFWGSPSITAAARQELESFAATCVDDAALTPENRSRWRAQRQNALRYLIALGPDYQTS